MPQLNPTPWFLIMLATWLTFSFILQPKILLFSSPNSLSNTPLATTKPTPWNWPWT
uniref:ATP synthase complex subunit 8 n=1 Tax=Mionectes macconnelli TaxID=254557 RepID=A0A7H1DN64_9TYRA|nr:ATP synthase F0 subunit 8 [Mionectes macconnelli]